MARSGAHSLATWLPWLLELLLRVPLSIARVVLRARRAAPDVADSAAAGLSSWRRERVVPLQSTLGRKQGGQDGCMSRSTSMDFQPLQEEADTLAAPAGCGSSGSSSSEIAAVFSQSLAQALVLCLPGGPRGLGRSSLPARAGAAASPSHSKARWGLEGGEGAGAGGGGDGSRSSNSQSNADAGSSSAVGTAAAAQEAAALNSQQLLLQLPPALQQALAQQLLAGAGSSRAALARLSRSCKPLRAAAMAALPSLRLTLAQLPQLAQAQHTFWHVTRLCLELQPRTAALPPVPLDALLAAVALRLPCLQHAALRGSSSALLAPCGALLQQQPRLQQLALSGRGGRLWLLPGLLQPGAAAGAGAHSGASASASASSSGNTSGSGSGSSSTSAVRLPLPHPQCGLGGSFTSLRHLTLRRLNLCGLQELPPGGGRNPPATRSGAYQQLASGSSSDGGGGSCPLALLSARLPRLSSLVLQQVVLPPDGLASLAGSDGVKHALRTSLQELSLSGVHQMRLQLHHVSALRGLTSLRLSQLLLAPLLPDEQPPAHGGGPQQPAHGGQGDEAPPAGAALAEAQEQQEEAEAGVGWQDGDAAMPDAESDDEDEHEEAGAAGPLPQQQQHALSLLHAATAAHDEAVAAALSGLTALASLSVSRVRGMDAPLAAALTAMGTLTSLCAPVVVAERQLSGCWAAWSRCLVVLQVSRLAMAGPWAPLPPLAALRTLSVSGLLQAPDGFLGQFAPALTSLRVGCLMPAAMAPAAAGAASGPASRHPRQRQQLLVGLAVVPHNNSLRELLVHNCSAGGHDTGGAAAGAPVAAAADADEPGADGALPLPPAPAPAAGSWGWPQLAAAAAAVQVQELDASGGLAAVADAVAAAAGHESDAAAGDGDGGDGAVPCAADLSALLLRMTRLEMLQLQHVDAGSRLGQQLPTWLCLWSGLADLRLHGLPSCFGDAALAGLVQQHGSSLTALSLSACPGLTWRGVAGLGAASGLRQLRLAQLHPVTVTAVVEAVQCMPRLSRLALEGLSACWSARKVADCASLARHVAATFAAGRYWSAAAAWRDGDASGGTPLEHSDTGAPPFFRTGVPSSNLAGCEMWEFSVGELDAPTLLAAAPALTQLCITL